MTVPPLANAREMASFLDSLSIFLLSAVGTATLINAMDFALSTIEP